jgi:hypothetical protein
VDDDEPGRDLGGDVELPEHKHDGGDRQLRLDFGFSSPRRSDVLPLQQRRTLGDERSLRELCVGVELERKHLSGSAVGNPDPCKSLVQYCGWGKQL